jgi:hypothetical protein
VRYRQPRFLKALVDFLFSSFLKLAATSAVGTRQSQAFGSKNLLMVNITAHISPSWTPKTVAKATNTGSTTASD